MRESIRFAKVLVPGSLTAEAACTQVANYLPRNYEVVGAYWDERHPGAHHVIIGGEDDAGWTMGDYIIPRLASGMYSCVELTA